MSRTLTYMLLILRNPFHLYTIGSIHLLQPCLHTPVFSPTIHILQPSSAYAPRAVPSQSLPLLPTPPLPRTHLPRVGLWSMKKHTKCMCWSLKRCLTCDKYIADTRKKSFSYLTVTQSLGTQFSDTPWTVEQLSFIAGQKSVNGDFGTTLS